MAVLDTVLIQGVVSTKNPVPLPFEYVGRAENCRSGPGGAPLPAVQLTFRSIGRVERISDVAFDVTNVAFMVTHVTF